MLIRIIITPQKSLNIDVMQELFLTCPGGLETICENELKTIGILNTRIKPGGVSIFGEEETIFKINQDLIIHQ